MVVIDTGQRVATKNPRVVFYLPEDLKEKLERLAASNRRSVSNMVLTLVEEAVKEAEARGELK